jgi:methylmalonyl-CoA mutase
MAFSIEFMDQKIPETFPGINFHTPTRSDWQQAAQRELEGADPDEKLTRTIGKLRIKPYYDHSDAVNLTEFALVPSLNPYFGPRSWMNLSRVVVLDENQGNKAALHALQTGADGILFELTQPLSNYDSLLATIKPEFCHISFVTRHDYFNVTEFQKWADHQPLTGCIFWSDLKASPPTISPDFFSQGLLVPSAATVEEEISEALLLAVQQLDRDNTQTTIHQIAFSVSLGTHLFLDIAKLKALRNLWYQVQGAYGVALKPVHLHAFSPAWVHPSYQPHGNMIKATTAALAAILGGCDSLTVDAEDPANPMANRIARNVSSILREESYLNKVADPIAGSYYLDRLVAEISQKAWELFKSNIG